MSLSEYVQRLVRIIPGVAGYQDKEKTRDTDKAVRMRLASELDEIKLTLERVKGRLMAGKDLSLLTSLDALASRLDKTANLIRFASRGYSGIFDAVGVDEEKLKMLYAFDLGLFDKINALQSIAAEFVPQVDTTAVSDGMAKFSEALGLFEKQFSARQDIFTRQ